LPEIEQKFQQQIKDCRELITHNRLSEAEQLLESLTEWTTAQEGKDPRPAIDCENEIARIAIHRGDATKAIAVTQEILARIESEKLDYAYGKGVALATLGASYSQRGDSDQATTYYNTALSIWKDLGDRDHIARCLNNLATIDSTQGRSLEALKRYEEALEIWTKTGNPIGTAACFNNIAILKQDAGDLSGALQGYRKALEEARKAGDDYMQATALDNLGWVYAALDAPEQALECLQDAETRFQAENDPGLHIDIAYGKASVLADIKRHEEAKHALMIGQTTAQHLDSRPLQVAGRFYEGYLNLRQHNLKPARIVLETVLEQAKELRLVEYILQALVHLIEIDLLEYRATFDEIHLDNMKERISEAYQQATHHQRVIVLVEIATLEALLCAANMELDKAIKGMEFVVKLTEDRYLPQHAKKAEEHLLRLRSLKKKAQKHLKKRIEREEVDEMLEAVRDVEKHFRAHGT
jgi:tetratricopeptide (TPR) repeat protein